MDRRQSLTVSGVALKEAGADVVLDSLEKDVQPMMDAIASVTSPHS